MKYLNYVVYLLLGALGWIIANGAWTLWVDHQRTTSLWAWADQIQRAQQQVAQRAQPTPEPTPTEMSKK